MGLQTAGTGAIIEIVEPSAVAEERIAHLQRELAIRDREERAARREMARLTEQLVRHSRDTRTQLERLRADGAAELERLSAAREIASVELHAAREQLGAEQARAVHAEVELEELRRELDGLTAAAAEREASIQLLGGELERAEDQLGASRRQLQDAERARAREVSEHSARSRRLEQEASALSVGLRHTKDDIERAARSRAWRLGHRTTRTLARLARRPVRTQGALAAALARIERVQGALHELPAPASAVGPRALAAASASSVSATSAFAPATSAQTLAASAALARELPPVGLHFSPAQEKELANRRAALAAQLRERLGPPLSVSTGLLSARSSPLATDAII